MEPFDFCYPKSKQVAATITPEGSRFNKEFQPYSAILIDKCSGMYKISTHSATLMNVGHRFKRHYEV
jgi:hypothetical protein